MIFTRLIEAIAKEATRGRRASRAALAIEEAGALLRRGDCASAKARYIEALELAPRASAAHAQLGLILAAEARYDDALSHLRAAQSARALEGDALHAFVRLLVQRGELEEAAGAAQAAVRAHPEAPVSWSALGLVHQAAHRYSDALECCDRALGRGGADADLYANRAIVLQNLGRLEEAYEDYARALELRPDHPLARFHRSLGRLASGDFAAGWPDYEMRLASADLPPRPQHNPRWDGGGVAGQTLLVYGEQGLGDEIMFASCIPDLVKAGARCVIECRPDLQRLFARSFEQAVVYAARPDKSVPREIQARGIDAEVPVGSLPLHFRRSAAAFPEHEGYLRADPQRVAYWRSRLDALGPGVKVGLSWRGGTQVSRASLRSIDLAAWLPILKLPGVTFVSLQYTRDAPAEIAALERDHGVAIAHWPEAIADYDETAALATALDLTISVCTSIVHLAGALGLPVWVLAPRNAEWRYGRSGETMPWYPSARIFRQEEEGGWTPVIDAVRAALTQAENWNAVGTLHLRRGAFSPARTVFERALALAGDLAPAHSNLGIALIELGDSAGGEKHLRRALKIDPHLIAARENLAALYTARFEHDAALRAWEAVLELCPGHASAHAARAFLAMREGRFEEARQWQRRALDLGAEAAPLRMQEASMLCVEGRADEARRIWQELRGHVDDAELDWELALCALSRGEFDAGWPLYEARFARTRESPRRSYNFDPWGGEPLAEGALLIIAEQGVGDEVMFASCYRETIARAGRCVIECEPRLARLFARSFPSARVVAQPRRGADPELLESREIVRQVHAGSLPLIFRRNWSAFPRHCGYLEADAKRVEHWRARIARAGAGPWVGIAWSGGLSHTRRQARSISPEAFAAILQRSGAGFVSLQHDDDGTAAATIAARAGVPVLHFSEAFSDFDETAALLKALECVLTVCSSVVHLAGALGVQTLVLTPARAEWRYLQEGAAMPWYPSVRLLRQTAPGDWTRPMSEARAALRRLTADGELATAGGRAADPSTE